MPVVINEIIITTNIEKGGATNSTNAADTSAVQMETVVKEAVERVMEILHEKKER